MDESLWNSRHQIAELLEENGLTLKKRFGQNFLIDPAHREKIVAALAPAPGDHIWEIGPGMGAITHHLLHDDIKVTVFEIDRGLIRLLRKLFGERIRIVEGDFLQTFPEELKKSGMPDRLLGNLPYSTGSVMIGALAEADAFPPVSVFTLQKEVGRRMAASAGSSDYSVFSLVCQLRCKVEKICDIGGSAFFPPPRVVSSTVRMTRKELSPHGRMEDFFILVHDLFASRRKTAANNLKRGRTASKYGWKKIETASSLISLDLKRRGETFSLEETLALYDEIVNETLY